MNAIKPVLLRSLLALTLALGLHAAVASLFAWNPHVSLAQPMAWALFVSVFAYTGWIITILPLTWFRRGRIWLGHRRYGELVWLLAALIAYVVLVTPWAGSIMLQIAWIPGLIGVVAGLAYRWLGRSRKISS